MPHQIKPHPTCVIASAARQSISFNKPKPTMPTNIFTQTPPSKQTKAMHASALQRLRSAAIAGAVALQLFGINALPHWGITASIAVGGIIASSAAQADDGGDGGDSGGATDNSRGGDGTGDGGGGTGGGGAGGTGTGGAGGSGNANSNAGSNTGNNGGGYGGGYGNANSGGNTAGYGAGTTTADANTGTAGTGTAPGAGAAPGAGESGMLGQSSVTIGNAPADPNAPGVAGFFGGDPNAPGVAGGTPFGLGAGGMSSLGNFGNNPATGLGISNNAFGLSSISQTQNELGVATAAVGETPIGSTPAVDATPVGCGGACTTPGAAIALGYSAGVAALLGVEFSANATVTFACSCVQDISVSLSFTPTAGFAVPSNGPTFTIGTASAGQYNNTSIVTTSSQPVANLGGQAITVENNSATSLQLSAPSLAATIGMQFTANVSLTNAFNSITSSISNFISAATNFVANSYTPSFR